MRRLVAAVDAHMAPGGVLVGAGGGDGGLFAGITARYLALVATELPGTRPALEKGEVAIFSKFGQVVRLTKDGDVVVVPAAGRKVLIGSATGTDPVVLKSELNSLLSTVRAWLNSHTHPTPSGASSAPTTAMATMSVSGSSNTEAKT